MSNDINSRILGLIKDVNIRVIQRIREKIQRGEALDREEIQALGAANTALLRAIQTEVAIAEQTPQDISEIFTPEEFAYLSGLVAEEEEGEGPPN